MQNIKVLDMLNNGRIDDLRKELEDEIYQDSLKGKNGAKQRYAAMKKYFKYVKQSREVLQKPCIVDFEGEQYTSFTNSYSLVLTTESAGEIELFNDPERYPNVGRLIRREGVGHKIDFTKILAEAKSKGYKLGKNEIDSYKYKYLLRYNGAYFKLGLIDATYAIINDGKEATVYHNGNQTSPITIENDIGVCIVLPIRVDNEQMLNNVCTVIDAE